ncbi:MAG: hypothetical protein ABEN55_14785, partial [Bradymonadaceae bacterium]
MSTLEPKALLGITEDSNSDGSKELWWWNKDNENIFFVDKSNPDRAHHADWASGSTAASTNNNLPGVGAPHKFGDGTVRFPIVWAPDPGGAGAVTPSGSYTRLEDSSAASGNPPAFANIADSAAEDLVYVNNGNDVLEWVHTAPFNSSETGKYLTDNDADKITVNPDIGAAGTYDKGTCNPDEGMEVFNSFIRTGGVKSRTVAVFTNHLDWQGTQGQYRLYSGTQVNLNDENFEGVLIRELRECGSSSIDKSTGEKSDSICGNSNNDYTCFHEQLESKLVGSRNENGEADTD